MGVYCRVRVEMSRSQSVIFRECVGDQQRPLVGGVWMLTYFRSSPLTPKVVSVTSTHPWHPWHMCPAISSYERSIQLWDFHLAAGHDLLSSVTRQIYGGPNGKRTKPCQTSHPLNGYEPKPSQVNQQACWF